MDVEEDLGALESEDKDAVTESEGVDTEDLVTEDATAVDAEDRQKRAASVAVSLEAVAPDVAAAGPARQRRAKASTSLKKVAASATSVAAMGAAYGLTMEESIKVSIGAKKVGNTWHPKVTKLVGRYSQQARLLGTQTEVTGPSGNTTQANFCAQVEELSRLGYGAPHAWYMLKAVKRHENVHLAHFRRGLKNARPTIVHDIEAVSIPHVAGMKKKAAVAALKADPAFLAAVSGATATWSAQDDVLLAGDHAAGGPTDKAEHKVVDPMIKRICKHARKKGWAACPQCP